MEKPKPIFCECCGEMKPWSTLYRGLQSRGNLMAVCPTCKEYLERKDKEEKLMKKRPVKLTEPRRVKLDFDTLCRVDEKKAMMILFHKLTKQGVIKCQ